LEPSGNTTFAVASPQVPWSAYRKLRAAFVAHYADWTLSTLRRNDYEPGRAVPVPDPVGAIFAWLWDTNRDEAAIMIADYMAELRVHGELAEDGPTVSFEDFLRGLRRAIPRSFADKAEVTPYLRREVPQYYGRGLDT
jgi:hypothetical protein